MGGKEKQKVTGQKKCNQNSISRAHQHEVDTDHKILIVNVQYEYSGLV
jgi:hypothetical protein